MAFSRPVWEVRTTGDDTNNGGGFDNNRTFPTAGAATSATGSRPECSSGRSYIAAGERGALLFILTRGKW